MFGVEHSGHDTMNGQRGNGQGPTRMSRRRDPVDGRFVIDRVDHHSQDVMTTPVNHDATVSDQRSTLV